MSAENLREQILLALARGDGQPWRSIAEATAHTAEMMYGDLADAVLALLGEVTVTEEWNCVVDDCDTCGPLFRRTVVTTRRVGEREEAE